MNILNVISFLVLTTGFSSCAPSAHIILIIGQSNSVGFNTDGHTSEDITFSNILQTSCCVNGQTHNDKCQLTYGQDPLHHQCDDWYVVSSNVGFGMSFARLLRADLPTDDLIVLVPAGVAGTGFLDNVWTAYTGTGFQQAVTRLLSTFTLIAQKYPQHNVSFDGILWHQGETDSGATTDEYLYKDLIPMIGGFRNSSLIPQSGPQVPFVVGNLLPAYVQDPSQPWRQGVLVALQTLDQYLSYTASTPSQGLVGDASEFPTFVHFSAKSQRLFGKRYYAAWKLASLNYSV